MEKPEKNEITYEYTRKRKEFGKQTLFEDYGPEMCVSIPCNPSQYKNYILRNPVHVAVQNAPNMSENWVNSTRAEYTSSGINHVEGGWPKDINMNDPEATQRYRRKIEKDDAYIHAIMHLGHSMEHNILQNNAVDMYQIYYSELPSIPPVERSSCHTVNVYREPGARRPVRSLSWQADGGAKLAVAHADIEVLNTRSLQFSYIWDIDNANAPELTIKSPQPLLDLQYNPRDQHTLVGGMLNGQVGWWDVRKGGDPVALCPPHVAHRDLVRNVLFINSKTGAEFFSSSPDGVVKWWDTRNMNEPTDSMIIDIVKLPNDTQSIEKALGISALEYEPTIPTRFMVGTETGLVIGANRKGKTPLEKLPSKYEAHYGPVYALQRNPTFLKNFLTVGDWTARVWSEDCRESSILWTHSHKTKLTDGAWNPIRFSLLLVTQWDGCLSCWDLLRRRSAPIVTAQLCDEPLLRLRPHEGGLLVACGSSKGTIYLAELSQNLGTADKNDKQLLTHILERENKRERILEARMRELRLKMRQDRDGGQAQVNETDPTTNDRDLEEASAEYQQRVNDLLAQRKNN
ncbi:dynein axonemal intermediate chain 2 [Papilio machaon]|uniref:dynein axonemal intermediate chain 2-like n=1 Tax=Papilio machaon TaxID=76193 RepID=UPI001E6661AB|nr:dynein axonemal intermediate chain 2-like [Papilio machaon]XP_045536255.1 dynein axonemal intermediate chain 2 [Papilio machaon]